MSEILAAIGAYKWIAFLILGAGAVGGVWYWHHATLDDGIKQQQQADDAASAKLDAKNAKETQQLKDLATAAEHAHDQELTDLRAYRDSHPVVPVRLCLDAHPSSVVGSQDPGPNPVYASASSAPADIQPVHGPDSGSGAGASGPDIGGMLAAFATASDQVSAELREYQARKP